MASVTRPAGPTGGDWRETVGRLTGRPSSDRPEDADTVQLPRRVGPRHAQPPSLPDLNSPVPEVRVLVERAQAGDGAAFGLLYDRYFDTVFRYVCFRAGNRQLAEDLTAEAFLRALKHIDSFTWQGRDFGAWLVKIARNIIADHYKSARYRLEITTDEATNADRADSNSGPVTNVALLRAVRQLKPEQQEVIVLRFLQEFSVEETSKILGRTTGAIEAAQMRALRKLSNLLPEGFQP
jgi:RNA polymerase sigma-70 factor (ECF subfamily)